MAQTVTISGKRHYVINQIGKFPDYYPSVTTVIGAMTDDSGLTAWRERIGNEEADRISKLAVNRGTVMHMYNENYLNNLHLIKEERLKKILNDTEEWRLKEGFSEEEAKIGRNLFYNFYHAGYFDRVKSVIMQEEMLWSPNGGGYAGRVDLINSLHDNRIVITDFKTSKKPKRDDWINNYKMQISAYYVAYWQLKGIKPSHGEVWISNESDNQPQIFIISENDIKYWYSEFIKLVKEYHKLYGKEINSYKDSKKNI